MDIKIDKQIIINYIFITFELTLIISVLKYYYLEHKLD